MSRSPSCCALFPYTTLFRSVGSLPGRVAVPLAHGRWGRKLCLLHPAARVRTGPRGLVFRSEEHTSELQSRGQLVCRLLIDHNIITYVRLQHCIFVVMTQFNI